VPKDDDSSGFTGKRNKSFRELDAQRGKSKYHSRQDDPNQQRIERSASYEKYKKAADSLFSPSGELPPGLAATFDPEGKKKEHKAALQRIGEAPDRKAWAQLVVEFIEKYDLVDDPFFLDSLLDHPKDRIVDKALSRLELLAEDGRLIREKAPRSLQQRLKTQEMTNLDSDVQARAKALRLKLF
jgi:hypothetical protein